jgi:hypothetical protein
MAAALRIGQAEFTASAKMLQVPDLQNGDSTTRAVVVFACFTSPAYLFSGTLLPRGSAADTLAAS